MKYKHIFDTTHLNSDLKKRSLRSGAVTLTSQAIMFVVQLGSTMILARILSPADYGINAMAVAITGFASVFSSLGLSTATIQRGEINHEQVSTLFWINVVIGAFITLIVASLSPIVAWFYKTPELTWVMIALSCTFFISGLSVQHSALLNRQMRFFSLGKIKVLSMLMGIIVAIITARHGYGYWALVFNTLTNVIVNVLGIWFCCRWIPGPPCRSTGVGSMLKFGSDLVGFNAINYFSRNLDNILIGRYHGSVALGIYSKAYQLLMMPITNLRDPVMSVATPALSRLQHEPEQYRDYYIKIVSLLSFVSMPIITLMFVCSEQIISLLLGSQWSEVSGIFKILAVAAIIQPVSSTWGIVLISTGKSKRYLRWGVVNSVVIVTSFFAGLPWGAKGVALAYTVATFILLFPTLIYAFKDTSIKVFDFLLAIRRSLFGSIGMLTVGLVFVESLNGYNDISILLMCSGMSVPVYLLGYIIVSGNFEDFREYYSYACLIFSKK